MQKSKLKTLELGNKKVLTRAEMRNVTGGTQHICTVACDVDSYLGHQTNYIQVPDCSGNPTATCTAADGTYITCICH